MERGVKALVRIMWVAAVTGLVVWWVHPAYRDTVRAWRRGEVEESAIWQSNRDYYRKVVLTAGEQDEMDP